MSFLADSHKSGTFISHFGLTGQFGVFSPPGYYHAKFRAASSKIDQVMAILVHDIKYRLVRGVTGGGFRGVKGGSCTKIAIN